MPNWPAGSSFCRTCRSFAVGLVVVTWAVGFITGCSTASTFDAGDAAVLAESSGVQYERLQEPGPTVVHVLSFDLAEPALSLHATVGEYVKGKETVAQMATLPAGEDSVAVAAVNGDYFEWRTEPRYLGTVQGTCIVDGQLVSSPGFPTFFVDGEGRPQLQNVRSNVRVQWPDGSSAKVGINGSTSDYKSEVRRTGVVLFTPRFGKSTATGPSREFVLEPAEDRASWLPLRVNRTYSMRVRAVRGGGDTTIADDQMVLSVARSADAQVPPVEVGDVLSLHTKCTAELTDASAAVAGGPRLLADGELMPRLASGHPNPRTAVGLAGSRVWLVVVDGRQPDVSVGFSHLDLAKLMQRLGCTDAVNLDGGGSSTMWRNGNVVNVPSGSEVRQVGNALVLRVSPIGR